MRLPGGGLRTQEYVIEAAVTVKVMECTCAGVVPEVGWYALEYPECFCFDFKTPSSMPIK